MINGRSSRIQKPGLIALVFALLCCATLVAYLVIPQGASEEYKYTVLKIFQFGFLPMLIFCAFFSYLALRRNFIGAFLASRGRWAGMLASGFVLVAIPLLSPDVDFLNWRIGLFFSICWTIGMLAVAIGLFLLAWRLSNLMSGALCLAASLALAFSVGELAYLLTPQYLDGHWNDTAHSKYVLAGKADAHAPVAETEFGILPRKPANPTGAAAHRELHYDREAFDALYTLTDRNRRVMPPANVDPSADLLLFGCSFTFGFGLNDEETWPWLLAKDLGPSWRVENYAYSGFGAQQMLLYLEQKMIDPPTAPIRQAVFLAIPQHIIRNSGLFDFNSVSYELKDNGDVVRGQDTKDSPLRVFLRVHKLFNGSQLARELAHKALALFEKRMQPEQTRTYLAIIEKSAKILREQYGAKLCVLLWPNLEYIAPNLESLGISVILARKLLKDWEEKGEFAYQIVPIHEIHPNRRAARELADGLAEYFRGIEEKAAKESPAKTTR